MIRRTLQAIDDGLPVLLVIVVYSLGWLTVGLVAGTTLAIVREPLSEVAPEQARTELALCVATAERASEILDSVVVWIGERTGPVGVTVASAEGGDTDG